ncbi:exonuclease domain-containing protein [Streptomyces sp. NPDC058373]|uniref:3'-5' exonuclease n=1 Tax=Streptomyces sp. NPDC058373 TaxID=3346465 RepID=UPI00365BA861
MSTKLAFVDTETTGLDPFLHEVWEVAVILREDGHDTEHTFRLLPACFADADPKALEINRYMERVTAPGWKWDDRQAAARQLYRLLDGAIVIGSNPAFDAEFLANFFGGYFEKPKPWHYRTIDVATLAAGRQYGLAVTLSGVGGELRDGDLPALPFSSYGLSRWAGVEPPAPDVGHTALGDARWTRDLWDALVPAAQPTAGQGQQ